MSSLAFLSPGPGALAKSPMEPGAAAAGAVFEEQRRLEGRRLVPG